jgi:hypothetical protein
MTVTSDISGRCLCGAVSFTAKTVNHEVSACHCSMCRRWTSGPFLGLTVGGPPGFERGENIRVYKSSEWGERAFCKLCGSTLYWRLSGTDQYEISAGTLEDQTRLALTSEIFIDKKPAYYAFANDTKKLTGAEVMAAFMAGKQTKSAEADS